MFFLLVIFDTLFVGEYEDLTDRPKTFGYFGYLCFVIWITIACVRWADFCGGICRSYSANEIFICR